MGIIHRNLKNVVDVFVEKLGDLREHFPHLVFLDYVVKVTRIEGFKNWWICIFLNC